MTSGTPDRLLLDEMISPAVAVKLRALEIDCTSVAESPHLWSMPDAQLLALAAQERRVVVTSNVRDFEPLREAASPPVPSLIYLPGRSALLTKRATGRLAKALADISRTHASQRTGGVTWL